MKVDQSPPRRNIRQWLNHRVHKNRKLEWEVQILKDTGSKLNEDRIRRTAENS